MKLVKLHVQVSKASPNDNLFSVREGASLLLKEGWTLKHRTWSNWILMPPAGAKNVSPIIETVIPEIYEVQELAFKLHQSGLPWRGRAFGWNAEYSNSQERTLSGHPVRKVNFPAYFFIGELGLWMISFRWELGDENPPRLIIDTSCVVQDSPLNSKYDMSTKNTFG